MFLSRSSLPRFPPSLCRARRVDSMNNFRAGLYSFASTTAWLRETGMASPPHLVTLGLTLPDSRVLSGVASIGMTLANIATILPHLRQPILDSIHSIALAHERDTPEQISLPPNELIVDLTEDPTLASVPSCEREHQSPPLTCTASLKSVPFEPLGHLNFGSQVALPATPLPLGGTIDGGQNLPQVQHSLDADFSDKRVSPSDLFARRGRDALHIPLPVPDTAEVTFFDADNATSPNCDLGEESPAAASERSAMKDEGRICGKDGQFVTADLLCTPGRTEIAKELAVVSMKVAPTSPIRDHDNLVVGGTVADFPDGSPVRGVQSTRQTHTLDGGKETLAKRRPECLNFIPQSVARRYPLAPILSGGHCFAHRGIGSRHDHLQAMASPPFDPAMVLGEPRASCVTFESPWRTSVSDEVHPTGRSMGGRTFIETVPIQNPPGQGSASIPVLSTAGESTHGRQLDALCDRTSKAQRRMMDEIDGSDCDSDFGSDSQYSSGSSADESMLPHILGADLIAAIDANSESGLCLAGSKRTTRTPLYVYEDFLMSENSAADVSMIMHASSIDGVSDGETRVPATFRSLTYEDIQQWASGVVQKCVRQVYRSRVPAEPSSPSQASDFCAERPSGSGMTQCPLAGFHCKLGAAPPTGTPAPRTKEMPVLVPPTYILPSRKPLLIQNLRDIPEFVPRQRQVSVIAKSAQRGRGMRPPMDVTRDAATRVIARVESRARFNARQWLVGTEERRMASTAGGRQGTRRCA